MLKRVQYGWFIIRLVVALVMPPFYAHGGMLLDAFTLDNTIMMPAVVESPWRQSALVTQHEAIGKADWVPGNASTNDEEKNGINNHLREVRSWLGTCFSASDAVRSQQASNAMTPVGTIMRMLEQRLMQVSFFFQAVLGDLGELPNALTPYGGTTCVVSPCHQEMYPLPGLNRFVCRSEQNEDASAIGFSITIALGH